MVTSPIKGPWRAAEVERFLDRYQPLTSKAAETIVIFAVG